MNRIHLSLTGMCLFGTLCFTQTGLAADDSSPVKIGAIFSVTGPAAYLGLTVLLVEQNAVATLKIADRAYVMETGEITLEGQTADLLRNPEVRRAYLGKGGRDTQPQKS
jgi:ABC-type lipopolysaccharide export system ATPase subunit